MTISPPRGPAQGLVRGHRHDVGVRDGRGVLAGRDEPRDVGHVHHRARADLVRDGAEGGEVDRARVGRGPGEDELRLHLARALRHLLHVDPLGLAVDAVGVEVVVDAREVLRVPVREVAAVVEAHGEHPVPGRAEREHGAHVRLRAAVRLDVGVARVEERLGALPRQVLDLVHVLAAAVVPPPGVALGVLVREHGPHGRDHLGRGVVLGGDQLELRLLPVPLAVDRGPDLRVGPEVRSCV